MDCGIEKFFYTAAKTVAIFKHLFGGGGGVRQMSLLPSPPQLGKRSNVEW